MIGRMAESSTRKPLDAIDARLCERLMATALDSGGDHADLYFEYRSGGDYSLEDGKALGQDRAVRAPNMDLAAPVNAHRPVGLDVLPGARRADQIVKGLVAGQGDNDGLKLVTRRL